MMKNYILALFALALASCVGERDYVAPPAKECAVTINVATTDQPLPTSQTRSGSDPNNSNETQLYHLLIFLFQNGKTVQNGIHIYLYRDHIPNGSFTLSLPQGTFDIIIIGNHNYDDDSLNGSFPVGTTMETMYKSWGSTGSGTYGYDVGVHDFWGMRKGVTIAEGTKITDFWLHDSLARIDVEVTGSKDATGDFKMQEIRQCNSPKTARTIPDLKNWDFNGKVNGTIAAGVATAPSFWYNNPNDRFASISYTVDGYKISSDGKKCLAAIYSPESAKATSAADPNAEYLLIQGEYNGLVGWYRVDFWANGNYLDLLRNHRYKINIERVGFPGAATPEEAAASPANIQVKVVIWNDYNMGDTVFDGVHFLSINPQDIAVPSAQTTKTVAIKTDTGLTLTSADISCDQSWVNIVPLSAPTVQEDKKIYNLHLDIIANHDAAERTALVKVAAGRLTQAIRVVQEKAVPKTVKFEGQTDLSDPRYPGYASMSHSAAGETKYLKVECSDPDTEYYITISGSDTDKFDIRTSGARPIVSGAAIRGSFTLMVTTRRNDTRNTYSAMLKLGTQDPNTTAKGTLSLGQNPRS